MDHTKTVLNIGHEATRSLDRLLPRLRATFGETVVDSEAWRAFERRLSAQWPRLFERLLHLYGDQYDFFFHLETILATAARSWLDRPAPMKQLDREREADPDWFQSQEMMGGVLYVDLFAGDLAGVREQIPYFKELGLTYLHLMPLFDSPDGDDDGGYAVSDYRTVDPDLGTMDELSDLAAALRAEGISLVVDFVFNHTSDEHRWAQSAQAGDPEYRDFYYTFEDRTVPDQYEEHLREIFPTVRRGNFTWRPDMQRWVWTTFNSFQWDLNYHNPAVFRAMAEELLFLANAGVEALRLDAVPFIWKELGTNCENRPEAHVLIQAFKALVHVAAPSLLFKSEAIVHPDEVLAYVDEGECQLSYNPQLMALLWEALATREVRLLVRATQARHNLPTGCAWINYLRSHDDIGWTFDDADAHHFGIDPFDHRRFLNQFYGGQFEGSFARGLPFQVNPETGDARIAGTLASLAGLEAALQAGDPGAIDTAIQRILMLHSIILSMGGIPLLYLGDEVATLNDYSYATDPDKVGDARWVHRPERDPARAARRHDPETVEGRVFQGLRHLIQLRKEQVAFWGGRAEIIETGNPHLFGYVRNHGGQRLLVIANFSEHPQEMPAEKVRTYGPGYQFTDVVAGTTYAARGPLHLDAYGFVWLRKGVDDPG